MAKHKIGNPQWTKWDVVDTVINSYTKEVIKLPVDELCFRNGLYIVRVKYLKMNDDKTPNPLGAVWLSIRSNNRKAIRDWRHFQRIKSEIAGAEREAIEIFPPESSLVDGANQYHLWVLPEGETTPFTWHEGRQTNIDEMVSAQINKSGELNEVQKNKLDKLLEDAKGAVQRPEGEEL